MKVILTILPVFLSKEIGHWMDKAPKILIESIILLLMEMTSEASKCIEVKSRVIQISLKGMCTEHKKEKNRQKETDNEKCLQHSSKGFKQLANL